MPEVADLLLMQQRLRQFRTLLQLGHFVVNDSSRIADYQTACLITFGDFGDRVGIGGLYVRVQSRKHIIVRPLLKLQ